MKDKKGLKIIVGLAAILAAIAVLLGVYFTFREKPESGEKSVSVEVIASDGSSEIYTANTDEEYLRGVLDQIDGITYGETINGFGPMVTEVNGERAVYEENSAYWAFYVNGEYCNYGISDQPVNDGDEFRIEYTKA